MSVYISFKMLELFLNISSKDKIDCTYTNVDI